MMILQEKQGITKVIKIKHGSSIVVRSLHVLPFLKEPNQYCVQLSTGNEMAKAAFRPIQAIR